MVWSYSIIQALGSNFGVIESTPTVLVLGHDKQTLSAALELCGGFSRSIKMSISCGGKGGVGETPDLILLVT